MILAHELLEASAQRRPGQLAILDGDREYSYARLEAAGAGVASELRTRGIGPGDRVGVFMQNGWPMAAAVFGAWRAGATVVMVSPGAKARRLEFILRDCGVKALLASSGGASAVRRAGEAGAMKGVQVLWDSPPTDAPPQDGDLRAPLEGRARFTGGAGVGFDDVATIIYTSGSTAQPKGVMLTHRNLVGTAAAICQYLAHASEDIVCSVLPMAYSYGLCQLLGAAHSGHTLMLEQSFAMPLDVLARAAQRRATGLPGVPGMFARLIRIASDPAVKLDLSSIRYMTNAAAPMPPAQVLRVLDLFPRSRFYSMYGQTECMRASYLDPTKAATKPGSSGRAIPGCTLRVVDEQGRVLGPGETGELVVEGPNVMLGYWGRPDETALKVAAAGPDRRALRTGDLFRADADGDLWFVARRDDIFKVRGEKVSPLEIESVVHELSAVAEAAVVGVDDPVDGSAIKLVVVACPGATLSEQDIRRHCAARLESVLMPRYIEFATGLPRTDSGKVLRRELAGRGGGRECAG